ncbi:MAG: protein kinase [Acidobacteria bacterium]|nr:protein kinase [Acidobacteriota bacterium]
MTRENDQNSETIFDETSQSQPTIASSGLGVGATINGRYLIERELGRGGIGVVYLARDQQLLSKRVVVKVLLEETQQNEWVRRKFQQEIEALTRLEHPGIVGVLDAGALSDGKPFLVMQYVEGVSLRSIMRVEGIELERAAHLMRQIGRALSAAHDKGILHRDLKPENIMAQTLSGGEEQIKIIDFGIAKIKDSLVAPETVTAQTVGTILYMAPEQLSAKPVSVASDIYALGVIAHEMLTGRRPFNPDSAFQLLEMQRAGTRLRPVDLRPSLSDEAERVILKALAFNPGERYQSAREFGDELAKTLTAQTNVLDASLSSTAGATAQEVDEQHAIQEPPPAQKMSPLTLALGAFALVFIIGAVYFAFRSKKTVAPAEQNPSASSVQKTERQLSYSLTVQKMREGKPFQEPFETSGQEIFENGWQFWINIESPQSGYLYVINEGPEPRGGLPSYNVLYPLDGGSAQVAANQKVESPPREGRGYFFDAEAGTEKMWMIWAEEPVPELEAVKGVANPQDKGVITNPAQAKALQDFFNRHASPKPSAEKDKKRTVVKTGDNVLVNLLELEHH